MRAEWCWVLLFSGGRERDSMGPYGDLCRPKQLNTLFLFFSLLVSATELAQTEKKWGRQTQKDKDGSLQHAAVCCSVYTTSTHINGVLTFRHSTLRTELLEVGGA